MRIFSPKRIGLEESNVTVHVSQGITTTRIWKKVDVNLCSHYLKAQQFEAVFFEDGKAGYCAALYPRLLDLSLLLII